MSRKRRRPKSDALPGEADAIVVDGNVAFVAFKHSDVRWLETFNCNALVIDWGSARADQRGLAGRDTIIVVSHDNEDDSLNAGEAAEHYRRQVGGRARVVTLRLPGLGSSEFPSMFEWAKGPGNDFQTEVDKVLPATQDRPERQSKNDDRQAKSEGQAAKLLDLVKDMKVFRDTEKRPYAEIADGDIRKVLPITSGGDFEEYLTYLYYQKTSGSPSGESLTMAIRTLAARARHDKEAEERKVFIRTGAAANKLYLDLCDDLYQAVEMVPGQPWNVLDVSPVAFRRSSGMQPLPTPASGGSIELLRRYVNVKDDADFRLLVAWLLAALRPTGPYAILIVQGEQGSSKSTTCRVIRLLLDPHSNPLRRAPRNGQDLMISAVSSHLIAFDNLSGLREDLSDDLAMLASGGGLQTRKYYTNDQEVHLVAMKPIVLNGIDDIAERADLLDRAIILRLPPIGEEKRKEEAAFWEEFERDRPKILGAMLDILSKALEVLPDVRLDRLPRMADFMKFAEAVGRAAGWGVGTVEQDYRNAIHGAIETAADASEVVTAITTFMVAKTGDWKGTSGQLRGELSAIVGEAQSKQKTWPANGRALTNVLKRNSPVLRKLGVDVIWDSTRGNKGREVTLRPLPVESIATPTPEPDSTNSEAATHESSDGSDGTQFANGVPSLNGHACNLFGTNGLRKPSDGSDGSDGTFSLLEGEGIITGNRCQGVF